MSNTTPTSILLSKIRKIMPNLIANQILGTQPMTGTTNSFYKARSQLRYVFQSNRYHHRHNKFTNEHYKHFLKLNNRKKFQSPEEIYKNGYYGFIFSDYQLEESITKDELFEAWCEMQLWLKRNFKTGSYIFLNARDENCHVWFANKDDYLLFLLAYGGYGKTYV